MQNERVCLPLAAALALLAGHAATVLPAAAAEQQPLKVSAARGQSTLKLGGLTVRESQARIANQRVFTFEGSATVLVTWEEFQGGQAQSWFAISNDGGRSLAQAVPVENVLRMRIGTFDPRAGMPVPHKDLAARADNELFFVQFVATPLDEMRAQLAAIGADVRWFMTENTHIVRMAPGTRAAVEALPFVRWVGPVHPAYRVDEEVRAMVEVGGAAMAPARYSISTNQTGPAEQEALAAFIAQLGGEVHGLTPDQLRMEATLDREQLVAVLHRPEVGFIDPWGGPGETDMNIIRQTGGAVTVLAPAGFLGQGVRGEIFDTEATAVHTQWNGQAPLITSNTNGSSGTHGTSCYGINFATGNGDANATGLCPQREQGMFFWYTRCSQFTPGQPSRLQENAEATDPALAFRSCYQTSSVGSTQITNYSTISQEVDDYLFRVDYLSCQSQSNTSDQRSRPQAWAKNIVAVAGLSMMETASRGDDDRATGSSRGPAQDLRIKPELCHSYDGIYTTNPNSTYTQFGGTSGATPITAGHFGLLHQMWHQQVWPGSGGGANVFLSRPKSTTARALMINGSHRYDVNPASNPNNNMYRSYVGWGSADFNRLYPDRNKFFIVNWGDPLTNAQTREYSLVVAPGEPEFRVTMVYPDPAPTVIALQARVNDLTLRVVSPGGTTFFGNVGLVPTSHNGAGLLLGGNWSAPGGAANTYDTVENVFVQNPDPGIWRVQVIASQVVADGYLATPGVNDAVYSLVVSNVTLAPPPVPCYANCDGSTAVPFLNVQDFSCFLTRYAAGDSYANCDFSSSPPVLNVQDFSCFLTKYAAGCSAP